MDTLIDRLQIALEVRSDLLERDSNAALRLFAGFFEGYRELVVDFYGHTLVFFDYSDSLEIGEENLRVAQDFLIERLPWVNCVIWKEHDRVLAFAEAIQERVEDASYDDKRYLMDILDVQAILHIDENDNRWIEVTCAIPAYDTAIELHSSRSKTPTKLRGKCSSE